MSSFSIALIDLENGRRVRRRGWNGPDQWLEAQWPDEHSKMTEPYIYIRNQQGGLVPWLASQGDLFARDWEIVQ